MPTTVWPMSVGTVLLREATTTDVEVMLSFRNDPEVNRFMIRTHVDPDEFRAAWSAMPDDESDFSCAAEVNGEVVAIGFLELVDGLGQPGMPTGTQARIGYVVRPSAAGRGVGSAVAKGLVTAAFDRLGVRRVVASCNADNPASARILERLGMRREGHGRSDSWHAELGWVDGYDYALLDHEWRSPSLGAGATLRVELFPADVDASVAFYEALGFEVRGRQGSYASLSFGDVRLGLARATDLAGSRPIDPGCRSVPAGAEMVVEVRDVRALRDTVAARGIPLAEDVQQRPWGLTDFRVHDPDGYYWRFTSRRLTSVTRLWLLGV
jgi:RimJ/RimL family protein N-acetyltransferase/catechol 2,3-dioxygenase-like lactoylglutathione lyase family enzyme